LRQGFASHEDTMVRFYNPTAIGACRRHFFNCQS
jgi:hypothetical protein